MNAGVYQPPPVGRRGYLWRIVLAAAISLTMFVTEAGDRTSWLLVLDLVGAVASWILVFWRRRWPTAIAVAIGLLGALSPLATGPALWSLFSLATWRRWPRYWLAAGVSLVAAFALIPISSPDILDDIRITDSQGHLLTDWPVTVLATAVTVILTIGTTALMAAWGGQVGARRELLWTLRDRARRAEAERDLRVDQARRMERERIAREMHDGLAHRISQISMHAGALAYRDGLTGDELKRSTDVIQQASHQAMTELREVLGVLRDTDTATVAADRGRPLPTAADIAALIETNRSAGMTMITEIDDRIVDRMPDQLGRAVYRIVQEGSTNATRHASGAPITVTIGGVVDDHVTVEVSNPLAGAAAGPPGSGYGLIGLQERIGLLGGTLRSGPHFDRYRLQARIPWAT